jgi:hypothetical protein
MYILSFDVGLKNLAFCILKENEIIDWDVSEIKYRTNQNLCDAIVHHLDNFPQMLNCETVLIEKQPSRNNKMRIIEALLNAYFVIKGSSNVESKISKVLVYSAKYKLGSNTMKGKANYSERKKISIARCKKFLEITSNEKWNSEFFKSKKKDDLSDCLLQALAYNKHDIFQSLQDVENNEKVSIRKPSEKQERSGNYSRSNIKYLLQTYKYDASNMPPKLLKSIKKFYESIDDAYEKLSILKEKI